MHKLIYFVPNDIYSIQQELHVIEELISVLCNNNIRGVLDEELDDAISDYEKMYQFYLQKIANYEKRMSSINEKNISVRALTKKI